MKTCRFETRSLPTLTHRLPPIRPLGFPICVTRCPPAPFTRCYPRRQLPVRPGPFYETQVQFAPHPIRSILTSSFLLLTFLAYATAAETSPSPASAQAAPSIADPSVQSAIVAAVENDRKRFGGNTPVPATLIGVWDGKGHSFIRAFGDADLEKKVPAHSG